MNETGLAQQLAFVVAQRQEDEATVLAQAVREGIHTLYCVESFERLVRQNLIAFLIEYSEQVNRRVVSPQEVQVFAPHVPDNLPRRAAFFGRDEEMDRVLGALGPEERGWGVVIDGIGKTALAVEEGVELQHEFAASLKRALEQTRSGEGIDLKTFRD